MKCPFQDKYLCGESCALFVDKQCSFSLIAKLLNKYDKDLEKYLKSPR